MPFFHKWFLKNQEGLEQLLRGLWKLTRKSYSICNCAGPCSASTSLKGFALHLQRFKHLMGQNRKLSLNFSHMHSICQGKHILASRHHTMVKQSLMRALLCYKGFRQQGQMLGSPMGSACFQYRGISANWQCCPSLNLHARRQDTTLDPRVGLNSNGIKLASICSSEGLWCSWCLCKFEALLKTFESLNICLDVIQPSP